MTDDCIHGVALDETCVLCCRTSARQYRDQRDDCKRDLEAANIEVAHLREAFVTMEQAANQRETDLAAARAMTRHWKNRYALLESKWDAARAVLDSAQWPSSEANGRLLLNVDAAAWQAWKGLTP